MARMPFDTFSGLAGLGTGFFQGMTGEMNRRSALEEEMDKERRRAQVKKETDIPDLFDFREVNPSLSAYKTSTGMEAGLTGIDEEKKRVIARNRIYQAEQGGKPSTKREQNMFVQQLGLTPRWDEKTGKQLW